jgi:hypothetical protein
MPPRVEQKKLTKGTEVKHSVGTSGKDSGPKQTLSALAAAASRDFSQTDDNCNDDDDSDVAGITGQMALAKLEEVEVSELDILIGGCQAQVDSYVRFLANDMSQVETATKHINNYLALAPSSGKLRKFVEPSEAGFGNVSGQLGYLVQKLVCRCEYLLMALRNELSGHPSWGPVIDSIRALTTNGERVKIAVVGCGPGPELLAAILWLRRHGIDVSLVDVHASDLFDWSLAIHSLAAALEHYGTHITFASNVDMRHLAPSDPKCSDEAKDFMAKIDGCTLAFASFVVVEQIRGSRKEQDSVVSNVMNKSPYKRDVDASLRALMHIMAPTSAILNMDVHSNQTDEIVDTMWHAIVRDLREWRLVSYHDEVAIVSTTIDVINRDVVNRLPQVTGLKTYLRCHSTPAKLLVNVLIRVRASAQDQSAYQGSPRSIHRHNAVSSSSSSTKAASASGSSSVAAAQVSSTTAGKDMLKSTAVSSASAVAAFAPAAGAAAAAVAAGGPPMSAPQTPTKDAMTPTKDVPPSTSPSATSLRTKSTSVPTKAKAPPTRF